MLSGESESEGRLRGGEGRIGTINSSPCTGRLGGRLTEESFCGERSGTNTESELEGYRSRLESSRLILLSSKEVEQSILLSSEGDTSEGEESSEREDTDAEGNSLNTGGSDDFCGEENEIWPSS